MKNIAPVTFNCDRCGNLVDEAFSSGSLIKLGEVWAKGDTYAVSVGLVISPRAAVRTGDIDPRTGTAGHRDKGAPRLDLCKPCLVKMIVHSLNVWEGLAAPEEPARLAAPDL